MARQTLFPRDRRTTNRRPRRTAAQQVPAQMCLRRARRVKRMAKRSPSTAPINASEIVLLSNDRAPLPAIRKPQYAIATVHRIMRRLLMGPHLSISKYCHTLSLRAEDFEVYRIEKWRPSPFAFPARPPIRCPRGDVLFWGTHTSTWGDLSGMSMSVLAWFQQ